MREALETLLCQRRQERTQAALRLAAEALASDPGACAEAREIAADLTLVALSERLGVAEILTLDGDVDVYRRYRKQPCRRVALA